ncbi:MAG: NUDIX hydrolase [Deltaproteobacteria bacterium]|nr:NUDIX hydrolase [Deltaproteobacteria bacterium]
MKQLKKYCSYCGKKLVRLPVEGKHRDYCIDCDSVFYENPLPVACSLVVNDDREVLLVKRKKEPYRGMWCLPMGFAETGEGIRDAALRELKEEAGLKGDVIRLIDVDTVDNYFYGPLAIVTYEVRKTGGKLRPGDDAEEASYFPVTDLPKLAWTSNEKAVDIYVGLYRDTWAMIDSFRRLFPEMSILEDLNSQDAKQAVLLSNVLVQVLHRDREEISRRWLEDMQSIRPNLGPRLKPLKELNRRILSSARLWLKGGDDAVDFMEYADRGPILRGKHVALSDILTATALSRKAIWTHVVGKKILNTPLEIYAALELNNRIIFFYDKINYYLTLHYSE